MSQLLDDLYKALLAGEIKIFAFAALDNGPALLHIYERKEDGSISGIDWNTDEKMDQP